MRKPEAWADAVLEPIVVWRLQCLRGHSTVIWIWISRLSWIFVGSMAVAEPNYLPSGADTSILVSTGAESVENKSFVCFTDLHGELPFWRSRPSTSQPFSLSCHLGTEIPLPFIGTTIFSRIYPSVLYRCRDNFLQFFYSVQKSSILNMCHSNICQSN